MIKMLSRILFQISALGKGICICAYMHTPFLVVEIVDRFLDQALIFFVYSWRKRGIASIIIWVWQLLHKMPVLCVKISTPLTFCAFSKLTKIVSPPPPPHCDVKNDRSLRGQDGKIPCALGTNQIAGFWRIPPAVKLGKKNFLPSGRKI